MNHKKKTILFLAVTFLLGVVLGGTAFPGLHRSLGTGGDRKAGYREMFRKTLELTNEQSAFVDSLLDRYRGSMDLHRVAMQKVRDSLRTDIRSLLSDRQQGLYDRYIEDMNKRSGRHGVDSSNKR